ncbi:SDR family NAD(P)-dependent oxidoreductase [Glycomyces sp. NPDC047010]|uniref:SDR family NAD(P)-dependent oxidoreductase n=1 Tax=Glycomyces sp. NPDC047010 TaxID=3155023 RepID=UPI0033FCA881
MQQETWIITGANRGLGRSLTAAALANGHNVVAAVRDSAQLDDLAAAHPGRLAAVAFDVTDTGSAPGLVKAALDRFGRIDVLVNNAGGAVVGAVEEVSDTQLRDQMDLHLFGPAALVRAALPAMRAQGRGTVVQMSSQGGRISFPGVSAYSASKFALEGWSESLAGEVAPFGVRVMIVEPSRFRTGFHGALDFADTATAYGDTLAAVRADMASVAGRQEGDPDKAARIILDLVATDDLPLRLPLGAEAVQRLYAAHQHGLDEVARLADLARSADFDGVAPSVRPV